MVIWIIPLTKAAPNDMIVSILVWNRKKLIYEYIGSYRTLHNKAKIENYEVGIHKYRTPNNYETAFWSRTK
jgi:hypothetical protein